MQTPALGLALLLVAAQQPASNSLERPPDLSVFESLRPPLPPSLQPLRPKTTPVTGHVVLYNASLMDQTARIDMFIKVDGQDEFLRLVYCPYDCGFDQPAPAPEMIPPRDLARNGKVLWTFQASPLRTGQEHALCGSLPGIAVPDGKGRYRRLEDADAYALVPRAVSRITSDLRAIPCAVVSSWARVDRQHSRPDPLPQKLKPNP